MTKKHENLMIFQCFQQSDSQYLFYVTCLWNHKLVNVCWPSKSRWRSNRNLLTVACNCSILVIIIIIIIILFFFRTRDWNRESPKPHHLEPPNSTHTWTLIRHIAARVSVLIQITILDLEPDPCFQIFLNISKTYYRIFNCNMSNRRSSQELPFIFFELRAATCLWGRYDPKTENFTLFYIYLLHIHSYSKTIYVSLKGYPRATFHVLVAKVYVVTGAHYVTKSKIPLFA